MLNPRRFRSLYHQRMALHIRVATTIAVTASLVGCGGAAVSPSGPPRSDTPAAPQSAAVPGAALAPASGIHSGMLDLDMPEGSVLNHVSGPGMELWDVPTPPEQVVAFLNAALHHDSPVNGYPWCKSIPGVNPEETYWYYGTPAGGLYAMVKPMSLKSSPQAKTRIEVLALTGWDPGFCDS